MQILEGINTNPGGGNANPGGGNTKPEKDQHTFRGSGEGDQHIQEGVNSNPEGG